MKNAGTWPARLAGVVLVVLGFIPFAAFLDVGLEMPGLVSQLRDWGTGSALTFGIGLLAWMASRRGHWGEAASARAHPWKLATRVELVAGCSLILYALVATVVFSRRPLLIDELAQLWQAQRYAEGHLWIPAPLHREFFSYLHLVDIGDRVYSQFPPVRSASGSSRASCARPNPVRRTSGCSARRSCSLRHRSACSCSVRT